MLDYGVAQFSLRQAALASGFQLGTLRSLYNRGHFRIIGGEDKKGRGLAAELTLPDVMCIAVAKVAIDAGVHPRIAFEAGMDFAYYSAAAAGPNTGLRLPSHVFDTGFTVLVCHPAVGASRILNVRDTVGFADLFYDPRFNGRHAAVVVLLNDVERGVIERLGNSAERL